MVAVIPGLVVFALAVLGVLAVLAGVAWRPTASVVIAIVLCQELAANEGFGLSSDPMQIFGHQLYFTDVGSIPVFELFLLFAATAGVIHAYRRQGRLGGRIPLVIVTLSGLVVGLTAFTHSLGPLTVMGQSLRPYTLATAAIVLGLTTDRQPGGWPAVARYAGVGLVITAAAGMLLLATGRAALALDGSSPLFYDSALPAIAGAVFLTILFQPAERHWRLTMLATTSFIVLLSGRRNVWLAMMVALVVMLMVRRGRAKNLARLALGCGLLAGAVFLINPGVLGAMSQRLLSSITTVSGTAAEVSTSQHVDDLRYGWQYALDAPFLGYGPERGPLPGLAVQHGVMYVHNQFLIDWLRYGVPGLVIITSLTTGMFMLGVHAVRRAESLHASVSAVFLLMAPICAMTAPFFTTTQRWPVLLGLAVGAITAARPGEPRSEIEAEGQGQRNAEREVVAA